MTRISTSLYNYYQQEKCVVRRRSARVHGACPELINAAIGMLPAPLDSRGEGRFHPVPLRSAASAI